MQLNINIPNDTIAEKVLWMLEHFKVDGVEVQKLDSNNEREVLYGFSAAIEEINSIKKGTLSSRPVEELINEL